MEIIRTVKYEFNNDILCNYCTTDLSLREIIFANDCFLTFLKTEPQNRGFAGGAVNSVTRFARTNGPIFNLIGTLNKTIMVATITRGQTITV